MRGWQVQYVCVCVCENVALETVTLVCIVFTVSENAASASDSSLTRVYNMFFCLLNIIWLCIPFSQVRNSWDVTRRRKGVFNTYIIISHVAYISASIIILNNNLFFQRVHFYQ